jgi:hypothetical protein
MNTYTVTCTTKLGTELFTKETTQKDPHQAARSVNSLAQSKKIDHHFLVVTLNGQEVARHIGLSKGTIICF